MSKFNRRLCHSCRVVFTPDIEEQRRCYKCLLNEKEMKVKKNYIDMLKNANLTIYKRMCHSCLGEFESRTRRKTCSDDCLHQLSQSTRSEKRSKTGKKALTQIEKANQRWLKGEKTKRPSAPLDVLIKQSEYKRVMDDDGWKHFLKGRKWDRI
jgi:hypothetical protein